MKKSIAILTLIVSFLIILSFNKVQAATISPNGYTQQTPYGIITFQGGIAYEGGGFYHDIVGMSSPYAEFVFDFDVDAISFVAFGAAGGIYTEALDINGNLVDSYLTTDHIMGLPVALSGSGIRRFTFADSRESGWVEIGDVLFTTSAPIVPEPISSTLFIIGGAVLGFRRFRKTIKN